MTETDLTVPTVTLAGKEFTIPTMTARQNRVIVPGVLSMFRLFAGVTAGVATGDASGVEITTAQFDLILDIIAAGLSRAHPEITRDALEDMEISMLEMMAAIGIIASQAGITANALTRSSSAA